MQDENHKAYPKMLYRQDLQPSNPHHIIRTKKDVLHTYNNGQEKD